MAFRKKAEPLTMASETLQRHPCLLPQPPSSLVTLAFILVFLLTVFSTFPGPLHMLFSLLGVLSSRTPLTA